jgi:transposase
MLMNFPKSVNSTKFIEFLRELRAQQPDEKLAVFMDRLNVHRSYRVFDVCEELGIIRIFNASYSPNYNPIEGVIGMVKNELKRQRTHEIA